MPFGSDGSITYETVIARYNSDLANTLGNLVNRTVAMTNKYFGGKVSRPAAGDELDAQLTGLAESTLGEYQKLMEGFRVADALEAILNLARRANKYIDETAPWALAKDEANKEKLEGVLYRLLEVIRYLGALLQPFLPDTAEKIFAQIGSQTKSLNSLKVFGAEESYAVGKAEPLFARIDEAKKLAELEEEAKAKAPKEETKEEVPGLAQIGIEDFAKVELRAAKITACEPIPKAKKLLKLTLDDGTGTPRTVASGIAPWYKPEDLTGKTIVVVANLKPAKLCGVESNGMILAADCPGGQVKVLFLDDSIPAGSKIR